MVEGCQALPGYGGLGRIRAREGSRRAKAGSWRLAQPLKLAAVLLIAGTILCTTPVISRVYCQLQGTPEVVTTASVIVKPGDTLWSLARTYYPGADPRWAVYRLRELNGLTTGSITAGMTLRVELPTGRAVASPPDTGHLAEGGYEAAPRTPFSIAIDP